MLAELEISTARAKPEARTAVLERTKRKWSSGVLEILGVKLGAHGHIPAHAPNRARLVIANHRSPIDVFILMKYFGGTPLSRGDVADWPVLGFLAKRGGTLFVDRANENSRANAIRAIRRALQEGTTVIVFPEGTTHRGDEVRTFQPGSFAAARNLPVDICPVGLAYPPGTEFVDETFPQHVSRITEHPDLRVFACFGAPFAPEANARTTADRAFAEVQTLVHAARKLY